MVAERLGHTAEAFAANRHDRLAVIFLGFGFRDRFNIVANQADWTFRLDGDAVVERKEVLDLIHDLGELLITAKDDILLLEIGSELHGHEGIDPSRADVIIAPRGPGILAAS